MRNSQFLNAHTQPRANAVLVRRRKFPRLLCLINLACGGVCGGILLHVNINILLSFKLKTCCMRNFSELCVQNTVFCVCVCECGVLLESVDNFFLGNGDGGSRVNVLKQLRGERCAKS